MLPEEEFPGREGPTIKDHSVGCYDRVGGVKGVGCIAAVVVVVLIALIAAISSERARNAKKKSIQEIANFEIMLGLMPDII